MTRRNVDGGNLGSFPGVNPLGSGVGGGGAILCAGDAAAVGPAFTVNGGRRPLPDPWFCIYPRKREIHTTTGLTTGAAV